MSFWLLIGVRLAEGVLRVMRKDLGLSKTPALRGKKQTRELGTFPDFSGPVSNFFCLVLLYRHPDFQLGGSPAFKPGDALVYQCPLQDISAGVSRSVDDGWEGASVSSRRSVLG